MSFAYKKISPSDISISSYESNKQFNINSINGINGITLYEGENLPITDNNPFRPNDDYKTINNEYKRLVFSSIKHLFYKNYIENNGNFIESSSYDNYLQSTLFSGSYTTSIRNISNITGSSPSFISNAYDEFPVYDLIYNYDDSTSLTRGNVINVLSIDKNIYGSNIKPNTFGIFDGLYYIKDDGEGNIFDYGTEENYLYVISTGIPSAIYIGNILYSLGLIIITNSNYLCLFGSHPTTLNDYISYKNSSLPINFDVSANDFDDCSDIDWDSFILIPIDGYSFPSSSLPYGILHIYDEQVSYIPGEYRIGYSVDNIAGRTSNISYINLTVTQDILQIINFNNTKTTYGNITNIDYSFDITGGTPVYSYSFDNISYTNILGFHPTTISGSISSIYNTLYVKDYLGTIVTHNFNPFYDETTYTINLLKHPSCDSVASTLSVTSSQGTYYVVDGIISASISTPTNVSPGSHSIVIHDIYSGSISSSFYASNLLPFTYNLVSQSLSCFTNNGSIIVNNFSGTYSDNIDITLIYPSTSSSLYTSSINLTGLEAGTYGLQIFDGFCAQTSSIVLNSYPDMTISSSIDYSLGCQTIISMSVSGGISPYSYIVKSPYGTIASSTPNIILSSMGLNGGYVTASIYDNNGCFKTLYQEIYGRKYIYSGSYCEII